MTITVAKLIDPLKLRDELETAGYPYQAIGTVSDILTGYKSDGTTEAVPDAALAVYTAHDPTPVAPPVGLKVWDVSGVGALAGYDANGVQQVGIGADGTMVAGGDVVQINADGLSIDTANTEAALNALTFRDSGRAVIIGGLYGSHADDVGGLNLGLSLTASNDDSTWDGDASIGISALTKGATAKAVISLFAVLNYSPFASTRFRLTTDPGATVECLAEIEADLTTITGALTVDGALNLPNIWTDWTPTVTQSGSVTVTVTEAKYALVGKVCHVYAKLAVTGSGTGNNIISIGGQPAAMQPALTGHNTIIGHGMVNDSGSSNYVGAVIPVTATAWQILADAAGDYVGKAPNFALANGDSISITATYRIA